MAQFCAKKSGKSRAAFRRKRGLNLHENRRAAERKRERNKWKKDGFRQKKRGNRIKTARQLKQRREQPQQRNARKQRLHQFEHDREGREERCDRKRDLSGVPDGGTKRGGERFGTGKFKRYR